MFKRLKNDFIKDTAILTGGTIVAQIIPLIFYPILSRLFLPSEFGLLAIVTSVTTLIGVIATGKYEYVILITRSKKSAANLILLTLLLSFSILLICEIAFIFLGTLLSNILNEPSLKYWILVSPPIAFFIIIYQCYNEWCVRNHYFTNISINKITNTSVITLSKLLLGKGIIIPGGLIIGEILGRFISATACIYHSLKKDYLLFLSPSFRQIRFLIFRYAECPKYVMPAQLLNTVGGEIPVFVLGALFNATELGYYSMACMILSLPSSIISLAVRDAFRKKANDIYKTNGECHNIYTKTLSVLMFISFIGFSIFYLIAPDLFAFVLGKEWTKAGIYARILCPMVAISFVSEVGFSMFIIAEKMKAILWWQTDYLILTIISLSIGILFFNTMEAVLTCLVIGRCIIHLTSIFMSRKFSLGK